MAIIKKKLFLKMCRLKVMASFAYSERPRQHASALELLAFSMTELEYSKVFKRLMVGYSLPGIIDKQEITRCHHHKDLGVIWCNNLSWIDHIQYISARAYKMLGLLRRTFSRYNNHHSKKLL